MSIEQTLDALDQVLDKAWSLPLSGGRCVVDAERVRDFIDDMRVNLPTEIKQAQAIVGDRAEIISGAKKEAENIIRRAEERAKSLIGKDAVVRAAQSRASDILSQSQVKARDMRQAAHDFSDTMLRSTEETLIKSLNEVRATRQALRNSGK